MVSHWSTDGNHNLYCRLLDLLYSVDGLVAVIWTAMVVIPPQLRSS